MKTYRLAVILTIVNLALLILILVKSSTVTASLTSEILRAKEIELVDDAGQVRARFKTESDGQVVLRLFDEEETIRVKIGASEDGSGLVLLNDQTEPGIHLLADKDGTMIKLIEDGTERVIEPR